MEIIEYENGDMVSFYEDGDYVSPNNTPQPESMHTADPVVDIPEDVEDPHKWMNENMDSQPDESTIDQYLANITAAIPDVLPSYKTINEWLHAQNEIMEMIQLGYSDYIKDYRRELREWYMKRKSAFPSLNHIEIDGVLINTDESNIANEKINSAIRNEIENRNEQQDKGTEIS
jgi:hypothetical protein